VDNHPTPIGELPQLLDRHPRQEVSSRAMRDYNLVEFAAAAAVMTEADRRWPHSPTEAASPTLRVRQSS